MALISTEDAKTYLRVDSSDEDATVGHPLGLRNSLMY